MKDHLECFGDYVHSCFLNSKINPNRDFRVLREINAAPTAAFEVVNNIYHEVCRMNGDHHFLTDGPLADKLRK